MEHFRLHFFIKKPLYIQEYVLNKPNAIIISGNIQVSTEKLQCQSSEGNSEPFCQVPDELLGPFAPKMVWLLSIIVKFHRNFLILGSYK
jgi:type IV secretory pathway VirB2 component (pilin)